MLRTLVILSFVIMVALSGTACSSVMRTAEGHKYKPQTAFNFRFNNNQISHAKVYKRYVAYNKKQQDKGRSTNVKQLAKKSAKPQSTTVKKDLVAVY